MKSDSYMIGPRPRVAGSPRLEHRPAEGPEKGEAGVSQGPAVIWSYPGGSIKYVATARIGAPTYKAVLPKVSYKP